MSTKSFTIKTKNDILIKYAPDLPKRVIELAAETGVQLRHLDQSKRTLEELFIKLIDQNEKHEFEFKQR